MPQFAVSVVLTQAPLQLASPPEHVHNPALHELPGAHWLPQMLQFALSDWVSTQIPAHRVRPSGHAGPPPVPDAADEPPCPPPCSEVSGLPPQASGTMDVSRRRRSANGRRRRIKTEEAFFPRFRSDSAAAEILCPSWNRSQVDRRSLARRGLVTDMLQARQQFSSAPGMPTDEGLGSTPRPCRRSPGRAASDRFGRSRPPCL